MAQINEIAQPKEALLFVVRYSRSDVQSSCGQGPSCQTSMHMISQVGE